MTNHTAQRNRDDYTPLTQSEMEMLTIMEQVEKEPAPEPKGLWWQLLELGREMIRAIR